MRTAHTVIRAEDPTRARLEAQGWLVVARSWAAQLDAAAVDRAHLRDLVVRVARHGVLRELGVADAPAAMALDATTIDDYPGGVATSHAPLDLARATVGPGRRAFGLVRDDGLLAMTYLDVDDAHAETDFTVVGRGWRGRGLGTAVKAASVLALLDDGVTVLRTGGSDDNLASIAANRSVGYVVDEHWVTLSPPSLDAG